MTTLSFLSYLRSKDVRLSAEGDRLKCNAPEGVLTTDLRQELKERKAELLTLLHQQSSASSSPSLPPLRPAPPEHSTPLSYPQERLYQLIAHAPDEATYNLPTAFRLSGPLDVESLERSIGAIVRRHEVLRTTFEAQDEGAAHPAVAPYESFSLHVHSLQHLDSTASAVAVEEHIRRLSQRPFDVAAGPLYRVSLLRLGAAEHVFILVMHHLISDGWSFDVFFQELSDLYAAYSAGRTSPLDALPIQYSDFAYWQRSALDGTVLETLRNYWRDQLSGGVPTLELPVNRQVAQRKGYQGARQTTTLSADLSQQIKALSRREGVTLFMTFLAAYAALLHRHTGQTDIVLCSPAACRDQDAVRPLIGYFNNVLALRIDLTGAPSFRTLVRRVFETATAAYQHQAYPFQRVARFPNVRRTPLTRGMFALHQEPVPAPALHGIKAEPLPASNGTSNFDLALSVQAHGPRTKVAFEYKTGPFDEGTVATLLERFEHILQEIVAHPERPVGSLLPSSSKAATDSPSNDGAPRIAPNDSLDDIESDQQTDAASSSSDTQASSYVRPRSAIELQLAKLWEEVLQTTPVGIRDDFFDLGGHSLLAAQLFGRIEETTGRRLPLATIFQLSTIEELAQAIEDEGWSPDWSALVPIQPGGSHPPLFGVHSWEGHVLFYRDLAHHLGSDQPFYGLQSIGLDGTTPLLRSVEEMAARYIRELQTLQPKGPYHLTGRCFGATIAFEMAQQLVTNGHEVESLIVLDTGFIGDRSYLEPTLDRLIDQQPEVYATTTWYDGLPPFLARWAARAERVWHRPGRVFEKLIGEYKRATDAQHRRFQEIREAHWDTAHRYAPTPYPGPITLLFSEESVSDVAWRALSWELLAEQGATLHTISGRHETFMDEPQVRVVAEQLTDCLPHTLSAPPH